MLAKILRTMYLLLGQILVGPILEQCEAASKRRHKMYKCSFKNLQVPLHQPNYSIPSIHYYLGHIVILGTIKLGTLPFLWQPCLNKYQRQMAVLTQVFPGTWSKRANLKRSQFFLPECLTPYLQAVISSPVCTRFLCITDHCKPIKHTGRFRGLFPNWSLRTWFVLFWQKQ